MLTPEYLMQAADPVVEIYSQVEQDIIADVARRIVKTGYITDTAKWQLQKAKEFGYLQNDVDKLLSQAAGLTEKEVKKLMNAAGVKSLAYDDAIYRRAGLSPIELARSPALAAMLLQGTDNTLALIGNFTKTTAMMPTAALNSILDRAFIQIISGAFDPTTAIKRAIKELAASGINKIIYPSGATASIETSVRRAVTTGVNQAVSKLQLARAKEVGCELVETSSHSGARPEHSVWQGRVFCLTGKKSGYQNFYDATGYGTGAGLCGWNCYHSFYPFFEGLSTPSFSHDPSRDDGRSNDRDYELQQKQRYYERKIRASKKECSALDAAMKAAESEELYNALYEEFTRASVTLKQREARLREFIDETGRTRLPEREWTGKWNRSTSSKAVWANRKAKNGE